MGSTPTTVAQILDQNFGGPQADTWRPLVGPCGSLWFTTFWPIKIHQIWTKHIVPLGSTPFARVAQAPFHIGMPSQRLISCKLLTGLFTFFSKFAYLGKWTEHDSRSIRSLFHEKWVAADSRWRALHGHSVSTPIWQLWILSYFFEQLIIPPRWKPFGPQNITFSCPIGEGQILSPFQSQSIWILKDFFLWAPLENNPHSLIFKTLFFCQEWCLAVVHQGI